MPALLPASRLRLPLAACLTLLALPARAELPDADPWPDGVTPLPAHWLAEYRASPQHGTGAALEDSDILAEISSRFRGDPRLEDATIEVRARSGAVSLEGSAPTPEARQAAEEVVAQVEGVTRVENRISVPSDGRLLYPPAATPAARPAGTSSAGHAAPPPAR